VELVTAKEIGKLLETIAQHKESAGPRIRKYDFKRPDKFSKDQMRVLELLHENMCRMLTAFLSSRLRTTVQIRVTSVEQSSFGEFIQDIPNPGVITILNPSPLPGAILLETSPSVVFPMIDRLFGGTGSMAEVPRAVTELEVAGLGKLFEGITLIFKEAWQGVIDLDLSIQRIETNPLFAQVSSANEIVAVVSLEVRIEKHVGLFNFCLPHVTLEPVLPKLSTHQWLTGKRDTARKQHDSIRRSVEDVSVEITAVLGRSHMKVGEFMGLSEGDVLVLEARVGDKVQLLVSGKPKFVGYPARVGRRLAVVVCDEQEGSSCLKTGRKE